MLNLEGGNYVSAGLALVGAYAGCKGNLRLGVAHRMICTCGHICRGYMGAIYTSPGIELSTWVPKVGCGWVQSWQRLHGLVAEQQPCVKLGPRERFRGIAQGRVY